HHARHTVRFADAITTTHNSSTYLEIGPNASLTPHIPGTTTPSLHRDKPEPETLTTALATLIANGIKPNWHTYFAETGAHTTELPTHAFQRTRYWLESAEATGGSGHPLLNTAIGLADGGRMLLTGTLALSSHPWLAEHTVHGTVLLPGTAFVELALHAGQQAGHPHLAELTLGEPLVLTGDTAVELQVLLDEPGADGQAVAVFSRAADAAPGEPWTKHADGLLTAVDPAPTEELTTWPPADATPVDTDAVYTDLPGLNYGPAFQGLRRAWVRDDVVFAEVDLDEAQHADADRFTVHPALLDSALHPIGLGEFLDDTSAPSVPFSWSGVALHAVNPRFLRVRIRPAGQDAVSLLLADPSGHPVLEVSRLALRPLPQSRTSQLDRSLFRTAWVPAPPAESAAEPDVVFLPFRPDGDDAERAAVRALEVLQGWLTDERSATARLALVTTGSYLLDGDAPTDVPAALANAAVWGLVGSAQSEHPDQFALVDVDDLDSSWRTRATAAIAAGETQIAIRQGELHVPRLVHEKPGANSGPDWSAGTVLITGATGALGGLVARHLVRTHGARDLLLLARRPVPAELRDDLAAAGARVRSVVCDITDREQLAAALDGQELSAIVHCAGVVDDAVLTNQTPEHLHRTFAPKATAAWHLHQHTQHHPTTLILFSSA
ncbi:SDR family NAD(P)-dependent oxidoreductase, partial [Saccharopolyspora sp. NPDC000359]|uniref:SDR family NAD(P)-dependent oxidoreductase n=1 Tax=Saccharopolyspora sp. NPDC000359 TaxID=3154251 RepID=UPI003321E7B8